MILMANETNPRGIKRPRDGRGGGVGMPGGLRIGKNEFPCFPGISEHISPGLGRGKGTRRK